MSLTKAENQWALDAFELQKRPKIESSNRWTKPAAVAKANCHWRLANRKCKIITNDKLNGKKELTTYRKWYVESGALNETLK